MADSLATLAPTPGGLDDALVRSLDRMGVGVLIKDVATSRYQYVSEAARALWPGACDLQGALDADIFDAVQAVALRAADQQALAVPGGFAAEHRIERQGERRDYTVWRQALRSAEGTPTSLLSCW
ncbi:MAG TPA: hypothetical protein VFH49_14140, partial [Aquabacterium sp.]|nr:hypothetical protein [Aquabacterium sp.]